jgi:hypothetical protein
MYFCPTLAGLTQHACDPNDMPLGGPYSYWFLPQMMSQHCRHLVKLSSSLGVTTTARITLGLWTSFHGLVLPMGVWSAHSRCNCQLAESSWVVHRQAMCVLSSLPPSSFPPSPHSACARACFRAKVCVRVRAFALPSHPCEQNNDGHTDTKTQQRTLRGSLLSEFHLPYIQTYIYVYPDHR